MVASSTLSVAEASRIAGISRPAIDKHVRAGRILKVADGLDRVSFDAWMAERTGASAPATLPQVAVSVSVDGPAAENARAALALLDENGVFATRADAERHRDSFIARLRQIEYDQKAGSVTDNAEVARLVGEAYTKVRTRLMAIPAEQAPQLHRCKSVLELQDLLLVLMTRALEELAFDGGPSA